ncbi:MAG TPA: hypothetical protein PKL73_15550 [Polyangiaceae bacterium]|jgi:hypothetical protein|nr:MAG: hypothetical protein BWY17_03622 [Deltaproteobacteria bacterium ADurb.Bin207]HNS98366.1 hypothetical protein [Polyangiaceae bacterium]HNZ25032.1 hypothetical protein [Polyangiaceae bacterium]HOD23945.1 hypothetical protein [Polyangiaceae bacterium]HOE51276.1 hypothetical protein [Polyangiaceae bacterium]
MRLLPYLLIGALLPLLPSCKACERESDEPPPLPPATTVTPEPTAPATLTTVEPPKPGEIVRPELEDREDGITGKAITVTGAKANLQVPNDWNVAKADVQTATAADQKSRMGVTNYGAEGHSAALDKAMASTGLSGCTWQPTQSFSVGKDKLMAQAADGLCQRNGAQVSTAFMATEGLLALGSWDEGADRTALFGSMRSVAKVKVGTGTSNLVACCRALAQNAKSQPPPQSGFMLQAAAACEAAARNNDASAVNAALRQFGMRCN